MEIEHATPSKTHRTATDEPLPSPAEIHYHNIRGISRTLRTDDIASPLPFLSHWSVVMNDIHCELRAGGQDSLTPTHLLNPQNILHEEAGHHRKIHLQVSRKNPTASSYKAKKRHIGATAKDLPHHPPTRLPRSPHLRLALRPLDRQLPRFRAAPLPRPPPRLRCHARTSARRGTEYLAAGSDGCERGF